MYERSGQRVENSNEVILLIQVTLESTQHFTNMIARPSLIRSRVGRA